MFRLLKRLKDLPSLLIEKGKKVEVRYYMGSKKVEVGGKTGTTNNYSDGWFVGITPNLVTTVWTGCDDRSSHFSDDRGYGSNSALPIFGILMKKIYEDKTINSITEKDKFVFPKLTNDQIKKINSNMKCDNPCLICVIVEKKTKCECEEDSW